MNNYLKVEDVANLLEITPSALTKYYLLFEKNNHRFNRSNQGKLMFSDNDVKLFRKFIQLKNAPDFTVEKAVIKVLEESIADIIDLTHQVQSLRRESTELEQLIQNQVQIIKMQQKQQHRIEELYKLHKRSVGEIEEFIKQKKLSNQPSILFKSHKS
ncbi:hypothetical protein [Priestia megaterium]|uniref:hypothetical protein n=1 Tax=Priestia megaterium TaxID=1404 RepID=UPI002A6AF62F|nr:hypothetical protein [Priestia megaterium]MDY0943428.1 hypothetical protein [Priestia megaterium]